jgi:hypothetical protein
MGSGYCLPRQVNSCTGAVRQVKKERTATRTGREPTCNQGRQRNPSVTRTGGETQPATRTGRESQLQPGQAENPSCN